MLDLAHPAPHVFKHHGRFETISAPQESRDEENLWIPPIVRTIATKGDGVPDLVAAISQHQQHLENTGERQIRDRARLQAELDTLIQANLAHRWRQKVSQNQYQEMLEALIARQISPYQAAAVLVDGGGPA
jgi:LAO/AO transport system kinase